MMLLVISFIFIFRSDSVGDRSDGARDRSDRARERSDGARDRSKNNNARRTVLARVSGLVHYVLNNCTHLPLPERFSKDFHLK